jgi:hypothetical protein
MLFNNRSGAIERTDNSAPLYEHSVNTYIAYFVGRNKLGIFLICFSTVWGIVRPKSNYFVPVLTRTIVL